MLIRWGVLYPLYVISELAIIFTECVHSSSDGQVLTGFAHSIAESLGAAIAINLSVPVSFTSRCQLTV